MKTIFRSLNMGLVLASIIALGAVAGFAQDPCTDADGQGKLSDSFRELYPKTSIDDKKATIAAGKSFLDKYGSCESAKEFSDYLKTAVPTLEKALATRIERERFAALTKKFDDGLKSSNWADVYDAGKQILSEKPDDLRDVELVLGSIGLDETAKTPRVTKWNDETLRFAKQSIADLEGGKTFKAFGVLQFKYKNKDDALGWMNYTIGYIYYFDKNNKKEGLGYLYKASQLNSDTKTNPIVFQSIGSYYFDDVRKLAGEVDVLAKTQDPKDTEDVAKQKINAIKAKVAMVNGTAEAAIDAYARAYHLAKADPKSKAAYTDSLFKTMQDLYNVRFGKTEGFDAFIAGIDKKPMPNPLLPVTPISDPEPVATPSPATGVGAANGTGVGAANGSGVGAANGSGVGTANGSGVGAANGSGVGAANGSGVGNRTIVNTTPVKTTTTPAAKTTKPPVKKPGTKPQAIVKKPVVKKKGA